MNTNFYRTAGLLFAAVASYGWAPSEASADQPTAGPDLYSMSISTDLSAPLERPQRLESSEVPLPAPFTSPPSAPTIRRLDGFASSRSYGPPQNDWQDGREPGPLEMAGEQPAPAEPPPTQDGTLALILIVGGGLAGGYLVLRQLLAGDEESAEMMAPVVYASKSKQAVGHPG